MRLYDHSLAVGQRLFRWRSYVPLLFLPAFVLAAIDNRHLVQSPGRHLAWQVAALAVALTGIMVRVLTVGYAAFGSSGRNQREQKAESLNTTGLYSVVRHPLYLGNGLVLFGLSLLPGTWYLPLIVVPFTALYYERIMLVEEQYIETRFGDAFSRWAAQVPAIVPAWRLWRPPALPFCWQVAVRAEIYGVFQIVAAAAFVDVVQRWAARGAPTLDTPWVPAFGVTAVLWALARHARKHTRLLTVEGR